MECFIFYHFSSFGYVWFRKFGYEKFEGKCMGRKYEGKRGSKYKENRKEKYIKI